MRSHSSSVVLPLTPRRAFQLLVTPSDIRAWWGASRAIVLAEKGGTWAAAWGADEDDPEYLTIATITEFDPGQRLVLSNYRYRARSGELPFKADFRTAFDSQSAPGGSVMGVTQEGFPGTSDADEFFAACEKGWATTLHSMAQYAWSHAH